jgi:class 3 adenylate cyclase
MSRSVREWLEQLGLPQYAEGFESNDIDFDLLRRLTEQTLKDVGVASAGHRLRILGAIEQLKNPAVEDSSSQSVPAEATFRAGSRVNDQGERRQLTVLFCDLVGSTELSHRLDPEEYRAIVRSYQDTCSAVIGKYEGHIAQYLGDGLLVYFGYPQAHEDDAARAARAALAMIAHVSKLTPASGQLSIRVGIHTGLVVVGEVGSGRTAEQLALGENAKHRCACTRVGQAEYGRHHQPHSAVDQLALRGSGVRCASVERHRAPDQYL